MFSCVFPTGSGSANVSFLAEYTNDNSPASGDVIIFTEVTHNAGGGYDPTTGKFTAPTAGTYVVLAGLQGVGRHAGDQSVWVWLMLDGVLQVEVLTEADRDGDDYDASSVQAVLRLGKGQQLWLQADGSQNSLFDGWSSWYSAALLTADP